MNTKKIPRIVIGKAVAEVLECPGIVFSCRGYQYRTTESGLECWGVGSTGELCWVEAEKDRHLLVKNSITVLREKPEKENSGLDTLENKLSGEREVVRLRNQLQALHLELRQLRVDKVYTISSGNAVYLRNELREVLENRIRNIDKSTSPENTAFQKGSVEAYTYAIKRLDAMMDWLGMDKNAFPTL